MKGKTKKSIIVLVVLLAIGFAAVTTTLTINGIIHLGANQENFQNELKFTRASLDYSDETKTDILDVTGGSTNVDNLSIAEDGKSISFNTDTLKSIGESVTLNYDITNNSQYTAEFTGITCKVYDGEKTDSSVAVTPEYIRVEPEALTETTSNGEGVEVTENIKLAPTAKLENKNVKVTMIKSYVGTETETTKNYTVECTIDASGLSE